MTTTAMYTNDLAGADAVVGTRSGLELRRIRLRDRVSAWVRGSSLDDELARGLAPEERWLRAVRASHLTAQREELARDWARLVARAASGAPTHINAVPIRRRAVLDAGEVIDELVAALEAPGPVDVRGLAIANRLLTDGTGPVFRARSPEHLAAAVAGAIRHLHAMPSPPTTVRR